MRLRRLPLKGAHPVAWQSQFHGCPGRTAPSVSWDACGEAALHGLL